MSIVCGVIKDKKIAIAADTQSNFGSTQVLGKHMKHPSKIFQCGDSYVGMVGWQAMFTAFEYLMEHDKDRIHLGNRSEIFATLLTLHKKMKNDLFLETKEHDDQPVESSQLDAIVINQNGLYQFSSMREVNEFKTYWAIGSGRRYALGAMQALYDKDYSAKQIAEAGAKAAAEFDDGCGLPVHVKSMKLG